MTTKKPVYYIDNNQFYDVLVEFLRECDEAEARGEELPRVPEFIGECFMLLATNIARAPNWSRYPFIQDMKSDAVLNCIKYIRNFKPTRICMETGKVIKNRPFSYFTAYVHNSYKQTVKEEKKNLYKRYKEYQAFQVEVQLSDEGWACPEELNEISNAYIENYEESLEREKERKRDTRRKRNTMHSMQDFFEDE